MHGHARGHIAPRGTEFLWLVFLILILALLPSSGVFICLLAGNSNLFVPLTPLAEVQVCVGELSLRELEGKCGRWSELGDTEPVE